MSAFALRYDKSSLAGRRWPECVINTMQVACQRKNLLMLGVICAPGGCIAALFRTTAVRMKGACTGLARGHCFRFYGFTASRGTRTLKASRLKPLLLSMAGAACRDTTSLLETGIGYAQAASEASAAPAFIVSARTSYTAAQAFLTSSVKASPSPCSSVHNSAAPTTL